MVQERDKQLIVATHGRGIYTIDLAPFYELHRSDLASGEKSHLFPIPLATRPYTSDVRPGLNFREFEKTPITFWLSEAGEVKLSVWRAGSTEEDDSKQEEDSAADQKAIASFSTTGEKGLNQFHWDLVVKSTKSPEPYFINYKQYLEPGTYRIEFETENHETLTRELTVVDAEQQD